jgi:hypothetical protein
MVAHPRGSDRPDPGLVAVASRTRRTDTRRYPGAVTLWNHAMNQGAR